MFVENKRVIRKSLNTDTPQSRSMQGFGDFGRRRSLNPARAVTRAVTAVARPITEVVQAVARPITKVATTIARPITRVAGGVVKAVNKTVVKPVVKSVLNPLANPIKTLAMIVLMPAAALPLLAKSFADLKKMKRQSIGTDSATGQEVIQYTDENGNVITEAQYNELVAKYAAEEQRMLTEQASQPPVAIAPAGSSDPWTNPNVKPTVRSLKTGQEIYWDESVGRWVIGWSTSPRTSSPQQQQMPYVPQQTTVSQGDIRAQADQYVDSMQQTVSIEDDLESTAIGISSEELAAYFID